MLSHICLCVLAAGSVFGTAPVGRIIYVAFDDTTVLKSIDVTTKKVSNVHQLGDQNYPTWSESSATNQADMYFYNFANDDGVTGMTIGYDLTTNKVAFNWTTAYFWRLAFDPSDPDSLLGLFLNSNNVELHKVSISTGVSTTVGMYTAGYTSPQNSAAYDENSQVFYSFLSNQNGDQAVIGLSAGTGKVVSTGPVNSNLYVCEALLDTSTGKFFGVVMDQTTSNGYLAVIDITSGKVTPVGKAVLSLDACDAGSSLSPTQRLYFAYVKENAGSFLTIWNLDTGALVEQFAVENAVFGMELFE